MTYPLPVQEKSVRLHGNAQSESTFIENPFNCMDFQSASACCAKIIAIEWTFTVKIELIDSHDIGVAVRAARKAQRLRQDDAAGSIGVSESFLGKVEKGAESVHWGKLFRVLEGLGVRVSVDIPDDAAALFAGEEQKRYARVERAEKRKAARERADE
jgi:transcriptional regulator with XRE-family HTH domain